MRRLKARPLNAKHLDQAKQYGRVDMTQEEIDAKLADEKQRKDAEPLIVWENEMKKSDRDMPRAMEDLIDKVGTDGLARETVDKYNAKKIKRAERPT